MKFLLFILSNPFVSKHNVAMNTQKSLISLALRTTAVSLLTALVSAPISKAQTTATVQASSPQALVNADPNYEAVRERLLNQPAGDVTFDRASLSTVLRMLATKAGIKWLSAQQNKDWDKQLVTLS